MENLKNFYINGKWVAPLSSDSMPILNPATEEKIGTLPLGNKSDVDRAVSAAKSAFESFSQTSKADRLDLLKKVKKLTERRFEDLAQAMLTEMGTPITFSRDSQADAAIGHLNGFIEALEQLEDQTILPSGDILVREPIGVCGLITPWNWPVNQVVLKVLPALATGCCCVLKPSEYTPISAMIYAEILHDAGYPAGVFNLVNGEGPVVGSAMSQHQDIQMMSFTGSTRAGTSVVRESAETVKRVTLELGGKSPNIVFSDCNLEDQIAYSVRECMSNTGQSCDAPTRLLVEQTCYDSVLQIAKSVAEDLKVGDPRDENTEIGPLFDKIQFERVQAMIEVGINEGCRVLTGGLGKPDGLNTGWFVKPTIFCDANNNMRVAREEIFGPVLVIIPFQNETEAIEIANDTPYGLASFLQTGDSERAKRVAKKLKAGSVHLNGAAIEYGTPFGGFKQSGNGREGGLMGLEDYLETKSLHGFN
jgi:aldehyde dehydrogenase (NAD+)